LNLILFERDELDRPLPRSDRRARHLLDVLRRSPGETFDAGLVNGPRGQGRIVTITDEALTLAFTWRHEVPASEPITLVIGLPRPQTARDILRDATSLGVAALHFVATEKGEPSYAQSSLWSAGEWRRHAITGAEQAFTTQLPEVTWSRPLADAAVSAAPGVRIALDNYEAPAPLGKMKVAEGQAITLAVGGERGWSPRERALLRSNGFEFRHLGPRVLRTETAVAVAVALLRAHLGLL
jgi:RsmE family RNA methyltransferase